MSVTRTARRQRGIGDRRLLALTALAVAIGIAYVAFQNIGPSAVYYLTPTEAKARQLPPGTATRLGGLVEAGSLRYDEASRDLRFILGDGITWEVYGRGRAMMRREGKTATYGLGERFGTPES